MNFPRLIESKRDGQSLTPAQLQEIIAAYTAGNIPDCQMAAFLMAVVFRGLDATETRALTLAMRDSGNVLAYPKDKRPLVDKHSTGGVGDKVSLPLAPLLACLGFRVPMISGRGLGITGGTSDKLDSIPDFKTSLPAERVIEIVQNVGCVICGQTNRIAPADKKLYALRDVTGTVPSIPLIVASILSKKLAENLDALVLDVKFGTAAFMQTHEQAHQLAEAMVALGNECGVNTRALLTRMDAPLGRAAGNWLEVKESIAVLEPDRRQGQTARPVQKTGGRGLSSATAVGGRLNDLRELVLACAAHLLVQTGNGGSLEAAHERAAECLSSGAPRKKWDEMLIAQGADLDAFNRKVALDHTAPAVKEITAPRTGFVSGCNARIIGEIIRDLGGGRLTKESVIHPEVGVDRLAKPGDAVSPASLLGRVHAADAIQANAAAARILTAFEFSDQPPALPPLIEPIVIEP